MAVSKAAEEFIKHECQEHGRTSAEVVRRWGKTYPNDVFTKSEADAVLGIKPAKKAKKSKRG